MLDDSWFDVSGEPEPGAFDGQPYRTYNVVPSALMMNFKAVNFQFRVDPERGRVSVSTDPVLDNLTIATTGSISSTARAGATTTGSSSTTPNAATLAEVVLDGKFSRRCDGYSMSRTALQHDTYDYGLFQALWKEVGGQFNGKFGKGVVPTAVAGARLAVAAARRGDPQHQQEQQQRDDAPARLHARRRDRRRARDAREGHRRDPRVSAKRGIDASTLVMQNGAGLSRDERASAALLASVLRAAHKSAYAPEFMASLSLGGLDGTTRGRFHRANQC